MKFLVLVISLIGVAYAHPDVSELSGSYLPGVTGGSNILGSSVSQPSGSYVPSSGSSILGGSIGGGYNGGGYNGGGYNGGGYNGGLVQDQRHVFFYAAPDDEAPARFRVNIAPSSHRNTKIIFVKAPSSGGVIPEVIAPPSQAEDKTLVYVLVKKQQHGGSVTIPSSLGVRQAKPQVYFIRYRNPQEAEQAVIGGINEQAVGDGLSDLGSGESFVRTLSTGGYGRGFGGLGSGDGGSSLLGATTGGVNGGVFPIGGISGTRYGTPGASGPYKR